MRYFMKYLHWNFLAELSGSSLLHSHLAVLEQTYPIMILTCKFICSGTRHGHQALQSQYRKPQLQWTPETPGPLRPPGTPWTPWDFQDSPPPMSWLVGACGTGSVGHGGRTYTLHVPGSHGDVTHQ